MNNFLSHLPILLEFLVQIVHKMFKCLNIQAFAYVRRFYDSESESVVLNQYTLTVLMNYVLYESESFSCYKYSLLESLW